MNIEQAAEIAYGTETVEDAFEHWGKSTECPPLTNVEDVLHVLKLAFIAGAQWGIKDQGQRMLRQIDEAFADVGALRELADRLRYV